MERADVGGVPGAAGGEELGCGNRPENCVCKKIGIILFSNQVICTAIDFSPELTE